MTVYVSITTLHYTQIVHFHCPKVTSINHFLSSLLAIWMQFISLQGYTNTKLDNCAYFSRTSEQCSTCNIQMVGNDLFFLLPFQLQNYSQAWFLISRDKAFLWLLIYISIALWSINISHMIFAFWNLLRFLV